MSEERERREMRVRVRGGMWWKTLGRGKKGRKQGTNREN